MELVKINKKRKEVVRYVEEHEVTVTLTPEDIAHITAALGVTCIDDLRASCVVRTQHITGEGHETYGKFADIYLDLKTKNAFEE